MSVESYAKEFSALEDLNKKRRELPAPVDDDFPQKLFEYDQAVRSFMDAARENGRR